MHIVVHQRLAEIDASQWNALLDSNNPFMRHEFLSGLEQCQCVCEETGWHPTHIAVYQDNTQTTLLGAMPCYIKAHSYGEYIFDWSWADAHHRHGIDYYPKLCNAIPFTPATGERWLIRQKEDKQKIFNAIVNQALKLVETRQLSSFHSLFLNKNQFEELGQEGFLQRYSSQFHWQNSGYKSFSGFLDCMNSKKRKNINRERRRVRETGVKYHWLSGDDLNKAAANKMFGFYSRTIAYYGAYPYLNKRFFNYLAKSFSGQTLFLFAQHEEQVIAGGLYFISDHTLYGRYWGALSNFHSVHFETCYYQPIEWCIAHGYQHFEAGAQGQHKLARGLEPHTTYSSHWIRDHRFRDAISNFLRQEQHAVGHYAELLQNHSPFKGET